MDNNLIRKSNDFIDKKQLKIIDIVKVEDYLFIKLDNHQNFLTNGKDIYDVSKYSYLMKIFNMKDKLCAVFSTGYNVCVVDLKTMEVLFEDRDAYLISKEDDRTLKVVKKINAGNDTIYDIETKKYLPMPENYEYEQSLGNNLYVFREKLDSKGFYETKRCVFNSEGKEIMKDIEGWIYLNNNFLIINKKDSVNIIDLSKENIEINTLQKNDVILFNPEYYDGNFVLIEKGLIKICTPTLEVIKTIEVDEINEVIDVELLADIFKICIPYYENGEKINKHVFVNLKTGKVISHIRIDGYPYWNPKTFVGRDSTEYENVEYSFYDKDFNLLQNRYVNSYYCLYNYKENMFALESINNGIKEIEILNTEDGTIKESKYDFIKLHHRLPYGYGVNFTTEKVDFLDDKLNVIVPNFDYIKYNLSFGDYDFSYFIVNDYVCITKDFNDGTGRTRYRRIIQKSNGEIVLDSINHECYQIGDLIKIIGQDGTRYLNTLTGELGELSIIAPVDDKGLINLNGIEDFNNFLSVQNMNKLLPEKQDNSRKLKKDDLN
ncbi:MAG: hypothetical protein J6B98_03995 [Bacilli bacterium]|nr:hypothetical protein [Bacilli bacterium]